MFLFISKYTWYFWNKKEILVGVIYSFLLKSAIICEDERKLKLLNS